MNRPPAAFDFVTSSWANLHGNIFIIQHSLIRQGGWPPEGGGSLGHVGMIIGGIISAFVGLVSTLLAFFCLSKSRRIPS